MLSHSLRKLLTLPEIRQIVVAINPSDQRFATLAEAASPRVRSITGGEQRQFSVLNALAALSDPQDSDWVLVHDAVRPCVRVSDIQNLIAVLEGHPVGGLLGAPLDNTIKQVDEEQRVTGTANRSLLWNALTPQMFRYRVLVDALQQAVDANLPVTDEASAVELAGQQPLMVAGDKFNLKITHEGDLALAGFILGSEPGSAPASAPGHGASTVREKGVEHD
ncbi:MAG: 2-C-methyl-D-erythritol 4-phosphate cytidylyltransferase [Pseudohongiellaceae bacterium]